MERSHEKNFGNFLIICCGQFMSILGSGISSFGLSVWIFQNTGQATPFALSFLCSILPAILFAPFAGSFADRKNRKRIIMLTDTFDALLKILMAVLLFAGSSHFFSTELYCEHINDSNRSAGIVRVPKFHLWNRSDRICRSYADRKLSFQHYSGHRKNYQENVWCFSRFGNWLNNYRHLPELDCYRHRNVRILLFCTIRKYLIPDLFPVHL